MESVGFKEWSLVCQALGRGEQSTILRKGGIAEGRDGFSFRHREFFLFPTFFHAQIGKVRNAPTAELRRPNGEIAISHYVKVERAVRIDSLAIIEALASFHVFVPELVRERFGYKAEGLNVAFVRVFRLNAEWILPYEKRFGGCRSWVDLPEPPMLPTKPVLDDAAYARRRAQFDAIVPR
jgi:hypothetical protein